MRIDAQTPVLVGAGQVTNVCDGVPEAAPSPCSLQVEAAKLALVDSGRPEELRVVIDRVAVIRSTLDLIEDAKQPFGRDADRSRSLKPSPRTRHQQRAPRWRRSTSWLHIGTIEQAMKAHGPDYWALDAYCRL